MNAEKNTNTDLDNLYQDYWVIHSSMIDKGHSLIEIAAILVAQSMSIYKTVLDDSEYNKMIDSISNSRDKVIELKPEQGHYH
jgi:hypothetical protein